MAESEFRIDFDELPWEASAPGARFKAYRGDRQQVRLLELTPEFVEPHWCEKGHIGFVQSGELEIEFQGRTERFEEGAVFVIPAGPDTRHKARALSPVVRVVVVEDV